MKMKEGSLNFSDHARLDIEQSLAPDRRDQMTKKKSGYSRISMPAMKLKSSLDEFKAMGKSNRRKSMNDGIAVLDCILATEQTGDRPTLKPAQIQSLLTLRNSLEKVEDLQQQQQKVHPLKNDLLSKKNCSKKNKSVAHHRAFVSDSLQGLFTDSDESSTSSEEHHDPRSSPQTSIELDLMPSSSRFKYGKKPETGVNVLFAFGAAPLPSPRQTRKQLQKINNRGRVSSSVLHQGRPNLRLQKLASRRASSLLAKTQSHAPKEWYEIADVQRKVRLAELLSWDSLCSWDFDMFEIDKLSDGNPLLFVGWAILSSPYSQHVMEEVLLERNQRRPVPFDLMEGYRFIDTFTIDQKKMTNFLRSIEKDYFHENPYHNNIHAADVLQTLHSLLQQMGGVKKFQPTPMQLFSTLLSAVVHDVGHPGMNNFFQQSSQSDVALCYNDQSVLENMHLALAFRKLLGAKKKNSIDIFDGMSREEVATCRKLMIGNVLGTDMSKHFQAVADVKKRIAEMNGSASDETTVEVLKYMMHCADISNGAKPKDIAVNWADRCLEEFFRQGDKEKEMGLPVSPLCNRESVSRPESQKGFIEFIIKPTFELLVGAMPMVGSKIIPILDTNLAFWNSQIPQKVVDGMEQLHDDFQKNDGVLADDETASMATKDRLSMDSFSSLDFDEDALQEEEASEELRREECSEELLLEVAAGNREELIRSEEFQELQEVLEEEDTEKDETEREGTEREEEDPNLTNDDSSKLSFGSMSFADEQGAVTEKPNEDGENSDWSNNDDDDDDDDFNEEDYDSEMEYEC